MTTSTRSPDTGDRARSAALWVLALVLTLGLAVYQRLTGPTRPVRGSVRLDGTQVNFRLGRTHGGIGGQPVSVHAPGDEITGELRWRYYPGRHAWRRIAMQRRGDTLRAELPHQPPAGKLEYGITLSRGPHRVQVPGPDATVVTRFKGAVSRGFLVPHIIFMFAAMLVSMRAGLEAARPHPDQLRRYTVAATLLLALGGMLLGPVVQWQAFGQFWTGLPFGTDLTDNKTLVAMIGWLGALVAGRRGRPARIWVLMASLLLLVIFIIPHSLFGSELQR
jgi:hypothetical protein